MELNMIAKKGENKIVRNIIKIDEEKCNGCGNCISPCAEGVIEIVDNKAKVISEELCDGLGACMSSCPTGALTIETREAAAFNEEKALESKRKAEKMRLEKNEKEKQGTEFSGCSCFFCEKTDEEEYLMAVRRNGKEKWVCTKCLPNLIHK
jgi:MinD superfamily P-loop ATPase containing an inserted ferredoxin domain